MVYKFGHSREVMESDIESYVKKVVSVYTDIFDEAYGSERDAMKDLGGYVLYQDEGTDDEIREIFDYTTYIAEYSEDVKTEDEGKTLTVTCYIISSDYAVVIVTHKKKLFKKEQKSPAMKLKHIPWIII